MSTQSKNQSVQGQEGHEGSSPGMKLPTDWTELPPELLMMIFDNLKIEERSSKEQRTPLLNCRLVHPRWKNAMDDLLEQRRLLLGTNWKQPNFSAFTFPVVHFNSRGKQTLENILFPAFLQGNVENCPFPTKSVCLTSAQTCGDTTWVLSPKGGDGHFFSKYGHHLTSLTIEVYTGRKGFTALFIQQLLSYMPHLKAMTLQNVSLETDFGKISLPPLPCLEHVHLRIRCRGFKFAAQNWFLGPYNEQLISIQCKDELEWENSPSKFPVLKQLNLHWPTARQLVAPVAFPSLKSLNLVELKLNEKIGERQINLERVFKFVSRVATTLVELQLDIVKYKRSKLSPINYDKNGSLQELQKLQQRRFPTLKMLTITFPLYEEEMKVVRDFLKMFPNLQTLNLTRFGKYLWTPDRTELHRTTVREHLEKEKYHALCRKLRTIEVYKFTNNGQRPFFTSHFPFSS